MPESTPVVSDVQSATWVELVPADYRRLRAAIAIMAGLVVSLGFVAVQLHNNAPLSGYWIDAIPITIGAYRSVIWLKTTEVRRYAQEERTLTTNERINAALGWWVIGGLVAITCWVASYSQGRMSELWFLGFLLPSPLIAVGLARYLRKSVTGMTEDAKLEYQSYEEVSKRKSAEWCGKFDAFVERPIVRYPFAAGLLWLAYAIAQSHEPKTLEIVLVSFLALMAAKELVLWLLGAALLFGAGWLIATGVAALPVSVAVILGAMIIASRSKG